MKASNASWKAHLAGKMSPHLATELDIFENEVALKKQGKIEDRIFAETRLRRGAYGQRYDNGLRHDGRSSSYPSNQRAALRPPFYTRGMFLLTLRT